jgi:hypothetical protein
MKRFLPLLLLGIGILLIFGGFVYDVMFAGIPYQDPTPEMSARYAYHSHIASTVCAIGAGAFLGGTVAGIAQFIIRRFPRRRASCFPYRRRLTNEVKY